MNSQIFYLLLILSVILLCTPDTLFSQPPPPPDKPDQTPIDGGISLLAVAGGWYAIHKLKYKKHK